MTRFIISCLLLVVLAMGSSDEPLIYAVGSFIFLGVQACAAVKAYKTGLPEVDWRIIR
jgi:hypothetical protein